MPIDKEMVTCPDTNQYCSHSVKICTNLSVCEEELNELRAQMQAQLKEKDRLIEDLQTEIRLVRRTLEPIVLSCRDQHMTVSGSWFEVLPGKFLFVPADGPLQLNGMPMSLAAIEVLSTKVTTSPGGSNQTELDALHALSPEDVFTSTIMIRNKRVVIPFMTVET